MKARTDDWVNIANAALQARDGLRAILPEFNAVQDVIGNDLDRLQHLDRIHSAVLGAVNGLRTALKGRARS